MNKPLVSVILPSYNRASLLSRSIQSILKQTHSNLELIIIDDGSTDNTRSIVKSISDSRIRYYYQKNRGVAAALNCGIKKSRGKYITFIGSDDEYLPNNIKLQLNHLKKNNDCAFVFGNVYLLEKNKKPHLYLKKAPDNNFHSLLSEKNYISAVAIMLKKEILKKYKGFSESMKYAEDYDLWLRIAKDSKFSYINKPLSNVYIHGTNLSSNILRVIYYDALARFRNMKQGSKGNLDLRCYFKLIFIYINNFKGVINFLIRWFKNFSI